MKQTLDIQVKDTVVLMASEIVYGQRKEWCDAGNRLLQLSLMRPRKNEFYPYDKRQVLPVIVWVCGGGFTEVGRNIWAPEMAWFAKHGYAVASVEYSVAPRTVFPQMVEDVKQAIRFLRAHREEYALDTDRIALMGESAGGYLTTLCALTGADGIFDKGDYMDQSSAVQAAIPWYGSARPSLKEIPPGRLDVPPDLNKYEDVTKYITAKAPPFLLLHGDSDRLVSHTESEWLYDELQKVGVPADLYIFKGADHADHVFVQEETKQLILDFLNKVLV